jgi:hypothetical protein
MRGVKSLPAAQLNPCLYAHVMHMQGSPLFAGACPTHSQGDLSWSYFVHTHSHTYGLVISTYNYADNQVSVCMQVPAYLLPAASSRLQLSSGIVILNPEGTTFAVPATLTLAVSAHGSAADGTTLAVYYYDKRTADGKLVGWREISAPQRGSVRTVSAAIGHFSMYAVMRAFNANPGSLQPPADASDELVDVGLPRPSTVGLNLTDTIKPEKAGGHSTSIVVGLSVGLPIFVLLAAGMRHDDGLAYPAC